MYFIYHEQVGFTPGKCYVGLINETVDVIHSINRVKDKNLIIYISLGLKFAHTYFERIIPN